METMGHQPVNAYKANVLADTALTNERYFDFMFSVPFVPCWSAWVFLFAEVAE